MYFFAERFQIKRKVMSAEENSDISENNKRMQMGFDGFPQRQV